ncbi:carboxypeptidase-like regulatory domain-containing protein, partial [Dyadobacter sp.]|uniref:carboxypeptidase-like regulatory domain-containing protein n=1 Tax=Dyadobacter sp. TaxID=1914288 RepID=UPI003F72AA37
MKKHLFIIFFLLAGAAETLLAQNRVITGKVSDANTREALPGVSVLVKGTQTGTASDTEGNFKIEVPASAPVL